MLTFSLSTSITVPEGTEAVSLNKTSRSQGEGLLRANVLKALQADPVSGLHHIVLRNMAAEGVMAEAFRQVVLEGGRVRYDFIILIFFYCITCETTVFLY